LKGKRSFEREVGQHAGGRVRCLPSRLSAFDYQDGDAPLAQRDRQRESNDPAADDDHVPGLHLGIVEDKQDGIGAGFIITQLSIK
jgi:hypothetical protein